MNEKKMIFSKDFFGILCQRQWCRFCSAKKPATLLTVGTLLTMESIITVHTRFCLESNESFALIDSLIFHCSNGNNFEISLTFQDHKNDVKYTFVYNV